MSELYDEILVSYLKSEHKTTDITTIQNPEATRRFVLYTIHEANINLTEEQIKKMWSVLTPEQLSKIEQKFRKDEQFWY